MPIEFIDGENIVSGPSGVIGHFQPSPEILRSIITTVTWMDFTLASHACDHDDECAIGQVRDKIKPFLDILLPELPAIAFMLSMLEMTDDIVHTQMGMAIASQIGEDDARPEPEHDPEETISWVERFLKGDGKLE